MKKLIMLTVMLISILIGSFFSCSDGQNPFTDPRNAKITLVFKDSKERVYGNLSVSDSVGNRVKIGINTFLFDLMDSVAITVLKYQHGKDTTVVLKNLTSDIDTAWVDFLFVTPESYSVYVKASIKKSAPIFQTGAITIYKKIVSANISPVADTISVDSTITFSVSAIGEAPFRYQWFHNNTLMAGKDNVALVLLHTVASDSGKYSCLVSDKWGDTVTTLPTRLVVVVSKDTIKALPPKSYPEVKSQTVSTGMNTPITINLTGINIDTKTAQWFIDTQATKGITLLSNENIPTVVYTPRSGFLGQDFFTFTVISKDEKSINSGKVTIRVDTVTIKPKITNQLHIIPGAPKKGDTITLSVTCNEDAFPTPTYSWFKDGVLLTKNSIGIWTKNNIDMQDSGYYRVVVGNSAGKDSSGVKVTIENALTQVLPPIPVIGTVLAGNGSVKIMWDTVLGASYTVYYAIGKSVDKTGAKISGVASSKEIAGLTNGTQYAFAITATNSVGESALSSIQTATPQTPATGAPLLSSVKAGNSQVTATWTDVSGATSYNLYYSEGTTVDKTGSKLTGRSSPTTVSGLINGIQYAIAVSAVNAAGESALSICQTATPKIPIPATPIIDSIFVQNETIRLFWDSIPGATSYTVYYAAGIKVDKTGNAISSFASPQDISGLTNGIQYAFVVTALNTSGESDISAVKTATPKSPVPNVPVIDSVIAGNSKVTIAWGSVVGATSYNLYYTKGSTVDKTGTKVVGITQPKEIVGLTNNTKYAFVITALNTSGESDISAVKTATPKSPVPNVPVIDSVIAGNSKATIAWSSVVGATSYNLYYTTGSTVDKTGTKVIGITQPKEILGLINNTKYAFAVSAENDGGESILSKVLTCTPVPPPKAVKVFAGGYHTLILMNDSTLWGVGQNAYGELGDGTKAGTNVPIKVMTGVIAASAGFSHSMILKKDNSLWACGLNDSGQLGDGTYKTQAVPVKIMDNVAAVSAGETFTMIIKTDKSLWSSGSNEFGQLGNGSKTNRNTPSKILDDVLIVSAGRYHTMILKKDNTLWATGANGYGQLGTGNREDQIVPVMIPQTTGISVSAGGSFSMILKNDGSLWGTGYNRGGELGDGTLEDKMIPVKIETNISSVSAGYNHSLFIKTDKTLFSFGENGRNELGDGSIVSRSKPVEILSNVTACSAGDFHSMAIKADGTLWGAGYNAAGQLGDGTYIDKNRPVEIKY